jgi:ADP-ribose pyrophosphatase YjhB (NUDIX family)
MRFNRAGIVLKNQKNELLIVKGRKNCKWGLPKGHVNKNESLEDCAKREFNEETGETITHDKFEFEYNNYDCKYYVYSTTRDTFNIKINDTNEIDDVMWINEKQIYTLPCNRGLIYYNNTFVAKNIDN